MVNPGLDLCEQQDLLRLILDPHGKDFWFCHSISVLLRNVSPALLDFAACPVNPQDTCLQQGTTMCVMLLKRLIEYACGLCRLLWLFGRERRGSREASAAEQLLNMEHSHGPALIYNVNMLVARRLRWKRWIDSALDKSFNGCVSHCGGGWFNPHQAQADGTCLQPQMLLCLCITWQFFVFYLFLLQGWGPV